ncbi:hypothetical protein OEIGOIKO_01970 [Streptomyces chrestomyceticus JCM 4735]|uniref:Uncharacterized protein n=1 Tax=Streptomyces chrestomyceticus JCM 4735 TaxID=1306181 RepID=A0A7U9KRU1_9ACTN|nr:hypothetical protein OEIGOIKO_01970 [Streptomyces chrestomyceticus JCM 4735]
MLPGRRAGARPRRCPSVDDAEVTHVAAMQRCGDNRGVRAGEQRHRRVHDLAEGPPDRQQAVSNPVTMPKLFATAQPGPEEVRVAVRGDVASSMRKVSPLTNPPPQHPLRMPIHGKEQLDRQLRERDIGRCAERGIAAEHRQFPVRSPEPYRHHRFTRSALLCRRQGLVRGHLIGIARGHQQAVAFTQRYVQIVGQAQHHLLAGPGAPGFHTRPHRPAMTSKVKPPAHVRTNPPPPDHAPTPPPFHQPLSTTHPTR